MNSSNEKLPARRKSVFPCTKKVIPIKSAATIAGIAYHPKIHVHITLAACGR